MFSHLVQRWLNKVHTGMKPVTLLLRCRLCFSFAEGSISFFFILFAILLFTRDPKFFTGWSVLFKKGWEPSESPLMPELKHPPLSLLCHGFAPPRPQVRLWRRHRGIHRIHTLLLPLTKTLPELVAGLPRSVRRVDAGLVYLRRWLQRVECNEVDALLHCAAESTFAP